MVKETRYQKFLESKQEKLRLEIALQDFFEVSDTQEMLSEEKEKREVYGAYLKKRIRPAMELLIKQGDVKRTAGLAGQGWFGEKELDSFLALALKQENRAVLLWLLHYKHRKFGFRDWMEEKCGQIAKTAGDTGKEYPEKL